MPFNKETGSKAGASSSRGNDKVNNNLRELLAGTIDIVKLKSELETLDGYDYVRGTSMILTYILPALAQIQLDVTEVTVKEFIKMDAVNQDKL